MHELLTCSKSGSTSRRPCTGSSMGSLQGLHVSQSCPGQLRLLVSREFCQVSVKIVMPRKCTTPLCQNLLTQALHTQDTCAGQDDAYSRCCHYTFLDPGNLCMQEASNCWAFDMFKLAAATSDRPLSALGFFLIKVDLWHSMPSEAVVVGSCAIRWEQWQAA